MADDDCAEMSLLVQANVDGELTPAEAVTVAAHVQHCARCAGLQEQLLSLSARVRREVTYHAAPEALRAAVLRNVAAMAAAAEQEERVTGHLVAQAPPVASHNDRSSWRRRLSLPRLGQAGPFGAGFALAAGLALVFLVPRAGGLPEAVISDHIRALQPNHLMDVVSTDQHTVKPWFDGRLDFAPPVKDFKAEGFPLAGGRLDYLAGRQVAALIYHRGQHIIDLYVWPDGGHLDHGPTAGTVSGYNYLRWSQDGMAFWAVSDLEAKELADFVGLMRGT